MNCFNPSIPAVRQCSQMLLQSELTRRKPAPPLLALGAFALAAIVAVFGFELQNTGSARARATGGFEGSVPGLLGVGRRRSMAFGVGALPSSASHPATRAASTRPSLASTTGARRYQGRPSFQGLTGVPVIALEGGTQVEQRGEVPTLVAEPGEGQGMTQAA